MILPLDSPHWNDLTACYSATRAIELLRQIVSAGGLGRRGGSFTTRSSIRAASTA
jgi:hypothetical protein